MQVSEQPEKITLETILDLNEAVVLVGDNSVLESKIAYWLAMLSDSCKSPVRNYNKTIRKKQEELRKAQRKLRLDLKGKTEEEKRKLTDEILDLSDKYQEEHEALIEQVHEFRTITFSLSDFTAKEEIKFKDRLRGSGENGRGETEIEVTIKAGQTLVPMKFFALMGKYVVEK